MNLQVYNTPAWNKQFLISKWCNFPRIHVKVKALLVTSMKYNCIFVRHIKVVDISSYNVPFVVYLIFGFLPVQNKTWVQLLSFFHTEEKTPSISQCVFVRWLYLFWYSVAFKVTNKKSCENKRNNNKMKVIW